MEKLDPFDLSEDCIPHTPHILLVNGPPRCGKDTIGQILKDNYRGTVYVTKMAKALKERTHALYGLMANGEPLPHDHYEKTKDQPSHFFLGISPRQAYIAVSERLMKPLHGSRIWGDLLLHDIQMHALNADLVVVTDSGFAEEAHPIVYEFGDGNVTLLHVMREGCNFDKDSRSYISLPKIEMSSVENNGTLLDLAQKLTTVVPGFSIKYHVEVQLPTVPGSLDWFEQGRPRESMEHALASIESLRQREYGNRVWRIRVGETMIAKLVMPGDAPLVDLRVAPI